MKKIRCKLADRSYSVLVGNDLLKRVGNILANEGLEGKIMVVTNRKIGDLYYDHVFDGLRKNGFHVYRQFVPDSEEAKSEKHLFALYDAMVKCGFDRYSNVLALGGGVVGDLSAFAASTFMRGIPFVNVPTTLLAQVDSAVGGKTGINLPQGKNLVGTFYQPKCVISDVKVLKTLPRKVIASSLAEVIKYGVIWDASFFSFLEKNIEKALKCDETVLEHMVSVSSKIKVKVVEDDEKEITGLRAILNFGHTFAHGFEGAAGYGKISHGEAVGVGMVAASRLAANIGICDKKTAVRVEDLVKRIGLNLSLEKVGIKLQDVFTFMKTDKKNKGKKITFVLSKKIGEVELFRDINGDDVQKVLKSLA